MFTNALRIAKSCLLLHMVCIAYMAGFFQIYGQNLQGKTQNSIQDKSFNPASAPANERSTGTNVSESPLKIPEITVIPPRIIQYAFSGDEIRQFTISLKSNLPVENAKIRIVFYDGEIPDAQFFSNNILWKRIEPVSEDKTLLKDLKKAETKPIETKQKTEKFMKGSDNAYYLTNIYGKPAEIPVVENYFKLEVKYRFQPKEHVKAGIEIVQDSQVIRTVPLDFIGPIRFSWYWSRFLDELRKGDNPKIAIGILVLVLLWFFYEIFYRRRKNKHIPLCSTRARFSTLVEQNEQVTFDETHNPFGCRLGGLKNRVQIEYKGSEIYIRISGKKYRYNDMNSFSLNINDLWKLQIEAQNYYGNDNQSHKNLVVLLLPV